MIGHTLRLHTTRDPFRRAGIVFGGQHPAIVPLSGLDGARLHALLHEPAITVQHGDGDIWQPISPEVMSLNPADLQRLVDMAAEAAPVAIVTDPLAAALAEADALRAKVIDTEQKLINAHQTIDELEEQVAVLNAIRDSLAGLHDQTAAERDTAREEADHLRSELAEARAMNGALASEIAERLAAGNGSPPKTKPKPTAGSKAPA